MTRSVKIVCMVYFALFAAAVLPVLVAGACRSGHMPVPATMAVVSLPLLGFVLTRRHSLLSYAFSFIPALPLLAYFLSGRNVWAIVSLALLIVLAAAYGIRPQALPKPRYSTQKWVSSLILAEVLLVLVILLIRH